MSFVHSKNTFISVAGNDLSSYTDASEFGRTSDVNDVTTYGNDSHVYEGGLLDSTIKASGTYDNTAGAGPGAVLKPLVGQKVTLIRRTEGTGSGKPQDSVDAVVKSYTETAPVADHVKWSADFQGSGDIDDTPQA